MARLSEILRDVHRLFETGTFARDTDGELLERFVSRNDESAFEVLISRHGPMVLRVCRDLLRDDQAAEDAFQTTFLVLARKARTLWVNESLSGWLYGVTRKVATKARSAAERQRRHELRAAGMMRSETVATPPRFDDAVVLHEEIARLPESHRLPIVLFWLQGMSYAETASRLGVTETVVRGRLARGKERLRVRLERRGFSTSAGFLVPALSANQTLREGVSDSLVQRSIDVVSVALKGRDTVGRGLSTWGDGLFKGVFAMMGMTKGKALALSLLLIVGFAISAQDEWVNPVSTTEKTKGLPQAPTEIQGTIVSASSLNGSPVAEPVKSKPVVEASLNEAHPLDLGTGPMPWETTVRVKVQAAPLSAVGIGSGTVVRSSPQEALILTCAHIFRLDKEGVGSPSRYPHRVTVDLFGEKLNGDQSGDPIETIPAELIDCDEALDVCLIRTRPSRQLRASAIVPRSWVPSKGMSMIAAGCSLGQNPTYWSTSIVSPIVRGLVGNPKYQAIECQFAPSQGRSGGGLFDRDGRLVGVCNFAEPKGNVGFYADARSIYALIDRNPEGTLAAHSQPKARPKSLEIVRSEGQVRSQRNPDGEFESMIQTAERQQAAGNHEAMRATLDKLDQRYRDEREALKARIKRLESLDAHRIEPLRRSLSMRKRRPMPPVDSEPTGTSPDVPQLTSRPESALGASKPVVSDQSPTLADHESRLRQLERRLEQLAAKQ